MDLSARVSTGGRSRYADAGVAALVVLVVGLMILPLPTPLLDILITSNISVAVLILLVSLYMSDGLAFAAFPTVLLVTTLYRLALNVSSTRLILLQADAGEVIFSFGNFVVRGNFVVGAIIFLILTLIQFLVIAKGSERVAEVGARFTLDAMPGKQMAIDAELRTGALSQDEARRRRRHIQRESQFYGAMDGAMKFVKGDAIAGIVITVINIVGGLAIGVGMHHMSALDSLRKYGLLTIGDGLVSQIPALLISTAAGIVVTRVASDDEESSLGRDIGKQIFGDFRPLAVASVFLFLLAIVPGLPTIPFMTLAAIIGTGAFFLRRNKQTEEATQSARSQGRDRVGLTPLEVRLGPAHGNLLDPKSAWLANSWPAIHDRLYAELGITVPTPVLTIDQALEANACEIRVREVPATAGDLSLENAAANLGEAVALTVTQHARDFWGIQETQTALERLEKESPALVRSVVPKPVSLPTLTDILNRLLEERTNVRSLREILEALAIHAQSERDPVALTELVRGALRRQTSHKHAPSGTLRALLLDPFIEQTLRDSIERTQAGSFLAIAPDVARDITSAITRAAQNAGDGSVILTQADVRRFVRKLIENQLPATAVLSYQELAPAVRVEPAGHVRLGA